MDAWDSDCRGAILDPQGVFLTAITPPHKPYRMRS